MQFPEFEKALRDLRRQQTASTHALEEEGRTLHNNQLSEAIEYTIQQLTWRSDQLMTYALPIFYLIEAWT